jgi:hypothetical protein
MSKVSDVMGLLRVVVEAALPSHFVLAHPELPEENNEQKLDKSVGVQYGPAINSNRFVSKIVSIEQSFLVVITRKIRANEYNVIQWQQGYDEIFEDRALVINAIEKNSSLGDSSKVARSAYVSDNGPERVFAENDRYVKIVLNVVIEYFE